MSAPICLNLFTFAESRKPDLWTSVCVLTFSSSAAALLIQMNFSFKSLLAIWSLCPQRFHYYFFLSTVSWQYQKYLTILILVLCLLCVTPLVCKPNSAECTYSFAESNQTQSGLQVNTVQHRLNSRYLLSYSQVRMFRFILFGQCEPSPLRLFVDHHLHYAAHSQYSLRTTFLSFSVWFATVPWLVTVCMLLSSL